MIAKGKESTEGVGYKRYIGVAPCYVRYCNPTKAQMEKAFDTTLEDEPQYVGEQEVNGEKYPNVRLTFLVEPDVEKVGFDAGLISISLYVRKQFRFNKDNTKVQVIDKYGRTAWVTKEQCQNHEIPVYSNGPANLDKDYRLAYVGEEELTNFIIAYLNIPSVMKYNREKSEWYMVDNPSDSECRLDHIEDYFKGDFSEVQELLSYQPTNKVKILFGVRTTDENKQYQATFNKMFLRNSVSDYSKLEKELNAAKEAGSYGTTEFVVGDFREYKVEETNFSNTSNTPAADNPWAAFRS